MYSHFLCEEMFYCENDSVRVFCVIFFRKRIEFAKNRNRYIVLHMAQSELFLSITSGEERDYKEIHQCVF